MNSLPAERFPARLPAGWDEIRAPVPPEPPFPPRLEASCVLHGRPFALCDACASVQAMARWANGLSQAELSLALMVLAQRYGYYTAAEEHAILFEAARRIP